MYIVFFYLFAFIIFIYFYIFRITFALNIYVVSASSTKIKSCFQVGYSVKEIKPDILRIILYDFLNMICIQLFVSQYKIKGKNHVFLCPIFAPCIQRPIFIYLFILMHSFYLFIYFQFQPFILNRCSKILPHTFIFLALPISLH